MMKVEHDPYTALFGKSWLRFNGEHTEPKEGKNSSSNSPKGTSVSKDQRNPDNWPSKSNSRSTKISDRKDVSGGHLKSEVRLQEHDQEYEIDPITNRKVLKKSTSPTSTVGHVQSQVKDVEKAFDTGCERSNLVSPIPLDRRFIPVEHAQALSSSNPPSKDTPPPKPHRGNGWLTQEGFGKFQKPIADVHSTVQTRGVRPETTATKIETALDRHLSSKSTKEKQKNDRLQLQYKSEENKREYIDLLRPSDVRASAGLRGNSPKETEVDKQARRRKLEKSYESSSRDCASQPAAQAASDKHVQRTKDRPVEMNTAPELRFGSWLKGTLQDAKFRDREASRATSTAWMNELSEARNVDPVSVDQSLESAPVSRNELVSKQSHPVSPETQAEAKNKVSKLKTQIVPFKAKLDAMKADYDSLRQQWLQEVRRVKEKAAKEEEKVRAQVIAKKSRKMHEEEITAQKVAMEAMEMRRSDGSTNAARTALTKGKGNDDGENPVSRRLQSFLQGEGDIASNVHEFAGRDRWYKRKAPHAMDAKDIEMDAKLRKFATDRALVREIRNVYEDTYGTIDTKHRQPDVPTPSTKPSSPPITSSSGTHPQLPSSIASSIISLRGLDESQISDALKLIQKLFGQLREVQSIIQDYRSQTKKAVGPGDQDNNNMTNSLSTFERSVIQIVRISEQLARVRPSATVDQGSPEAIAAANSNRPMVNRQLSTTAPEFEFLKARKLNTYCILTYDSVNQLVKTVEATTLAPFSKEEPLLPLDLFDHLDIPGKFLSHVISLKDKGYKPVSGTNNRLVFKKEVTPQVLAEIKKTDARQEPNPSHILEHLSILGHLSDTPNGSTGYLNSHRPFDLTTKKDVEEHRQARIGETNTEQHKGKEAQKHAVEKSEEEEQKVGETDKTAVGDTGKEKQALEEANKQQCASSVSPTDLSSDKVHRQEIVFSGSRQSKGAHNSFKPKKSKRAADRGRKTMKRMLIASGFTAACCYCVGVASEMMQGS